MRALTSTAVTEWKITSRAGLPAATAALVVVWAVVSRLVPGDWRTGSVALGLFVDVAGIGLLAVPTLILSERAGRTDRLLRLTPRHPSMGVLVRVGTSTAVAAVAAAALAMAAGSEHTLGPILGVTAMAGLFGFLAHVLARSIDTLTAYMVRLPAVAVPLLLPALAQSSGAWTSSLTSLSPVTGQLSLMTGHAIGPAGWLWQGMWLAGVGTVALRGVGRLDGARAPSRPGRSRSLPRPGRLLKMRSLLWADRSTALGDRLVLMVLMGVPLTAAVGRAMTASGWVEERSGIALDPILPVVWGLLVVAHTPILVGSVMGLLLLEDRDAGIWPLIATTRVRLDGLLTYRAATCMIASAGLTALGWLVAGARHPLGPAGVVATAAAAAFAAPVIGLVMVALARDRTQGVGLMKVLGVPLYAPLALWWVDGPAVALFWPLPTSWLLMVSWAETWPRALWAWAGGLIVSAVLAMPLLQRIRRSPIG